MRFYPNILKVSLFRSHYIYVLDKCIEFTVIIMESNHGIVDSITPIAKVKSPTTITAKRPEKYTNKRRYRYSKRRNS